MSDCNGKCLDDTEANADMSYRHWPTWHIVWIGFCALSITLSCQAPGHRAQVVRKVASMEQDPPSVGVNQIEYDAVEINGVPNTGLTRLLYKVDYRTLDQNGQVYVIGGLTVYEITHVIDRLPVDLGSTAITIVYPAWANQDTWVTDHLGVAALPGQPWTVPVTYEAQRTFYIIEKGQKVPLYTNRFKIKWEPGWSRSEVILPVNTDFQNIVPSTIGPPEGTLYTCDSGSTANPEPCQ